MVSTSVPKNAKVGYKEDIDDDNDDDVHIDDDDDNSRSLIGG